MKTIKQIADELGVSKQKVYRFIVRNHITASSEVKRSKLYDESAEMLIKQGFLEDELHQKSHHEVHQNHINDTVSEAVIELLRKELEQKNELDRKFKAQTASYDSFLLGLLLYGVLTTVFTAVRSEAFVSDFKTFFMVIWQFIVNAFQLLLKGGQWASQLGDKIPQPVVATIVHYLLLIVFVGGIAIGVGFLIFLGASKVFEFYTEDYADTMSLAVFLISLAVSVYFAEPIRAVIPINLLLLLILVHIVYVLIRWYVKGCMRSRGYY
jgi:plasmid maintenance system antidote protein VapI